MEDEIQKLRSKDECEQQLAVELSIGAVESIDDLIDQGHEVACEYACQLLFENMRRKVARVKNLPDKIVQHLLKDPCEKVRLIIIKYHWEALTLEQQEKVIVDAEDIHNDKLAKDYNSPKYGKWEQLTLLIEKLLKNALNERKEPEALRYIKIVGIDKRKLHRRIPSVDVIPILRDMPKVFQVYWTETNKWNRMQDIILVHPDEKIRMEEVKRILNKKTRVGALKEWQNVIGKARMGETLKGNILQLWVNDPSESIRQLIAMTTTSVQVLERLVSDPSNIIRQVAYPRYKKFQKRAAYSKAYQKRKEEKAREVFYRKK